MKKCFKCGSVRPLSDFYPHPMMADGHLNKCKTCAKRDTAERIALKMNDPAWVEQEMERHRKKQERYRTSGRAVKLTGKARTAVLRRHAEKYPNRDKARTALGNAVRDGVILKQACEVCGRSDSEGHHDDYSKPLDVKWLCPRHHADRHLELRRLARLEKLRENSASPTNTPSD